MIPLDKDVRLSVLVLVAASILISIRMSGYILPERYYFNFSALFKSDETAMLVEPPGVSGHRFCELIQQYRIDPEDIEMYYIPCDAVGAHDDEDSTWGARQSIRTRHLIIEEIISNRLLISDALSRDIDISDLHSRLSVFPSDLFQQRTTNSFLRQANKHVSNTLLSYFRSRDTISRELHLRSLPASSDGRRDFDSHLDLDQTGVPLHLTPEAQETLLKRALSEAFNKLRSVDISTIYSHPSLDDIDKIIDASYRPNDIYLEIDAFYASQFAEEILRHMDTILEDEGLSSTSIQNSISEFQIQFLIDNLPTYIISAVIRFFIIFIAIFSVAIFVIRSGDIMGFAAGAGLAGLLLTWPVLAMWEIVVRQEWQGMKLTFLLMYSIYVVSFIVLGYCSASVAINTRNYIHRKFPIVPPVLSIESEVVTVNAGAVATSLLASAIFQASVYAGSIMVPLYV